MSILTVVLRLGRPALLLVSFYSVGLSVILTIAAYEPSPICSSVSEGVKEPRYRVSWISSFRFFTALSYTAVFQLLSDAPLCLFPKAVSYPILYSYW